MPKKNVGFFDLSYATAKTAPETNNTLKYSNTNDQMLSHQQPSELIHHSQSSDRQLNLSEESKRRTKIAENSEYSSEDEDDGV